MRFELYEFVKYMLKEIDCYFANYNLYFIMGDKKRPFSEVFDHELSAKYRSERDYYDVMTQHSK